MDCLIGGCGRLGNLLAAELMAAGHRVYGLRRDTRRLAPGIEPIGLDLNQDLPASTSLPDVDWLVYAAAPDQRSESAYRRTYIDAVARLGRLLPRPPRRMVFVSSTAVYGQCRGEWVDEDSTTEPTGFNGRILLQAEQAVAESFEHTVIARCSGLYGPGGGYMMKKLRAGEVSVQQQPPAYTNRIHRQDAARAIAHLLDLPQVADRYLLSDTDPAPRHEVYRWLADHIGADAPAELCCAPDSDQGKRVDSSRLRHTGFTFRYPDFRSGYQDIGA